VEYETEEQQVEALKEWWNENGRAVIAGVVLGVVIIGAWTLWQGSREKAAVAASDAYSEAMAAVASGDGARVNELADRLAEDHDGTLYASLASLAAARVAVEANDLDAAASRLAWAEEHAPQDDVKLIARVRLARVEGSTGDAASGLERLPTSYPAEFTGLVEEARGDLLAASGDADGARAAYEKARDSGNVADPNALGMKLDDLAVAASAS